MNENVKMSEDERYEQMLDQQQETAYQRYSELRSAYEKTIKAEYDQTRHGVLVAMLEDLNEENK